MSSANNEEKLYVITYKELLFTFIVFSSILFVLYPKDLLKEQILSENSNYDLSMLYLENLLAQSPEDESLMLILAEQSLRSGKKDLSLRLLKLLFKSKNREYRERALLLSYDLKKDDYYYLKSQKREKEVKKELQEIFLRIYKQKIYDKKNAEKWYKEALFFNNRLAEHDFLNLILEKNPKDIALLERSYYLELELQHPKHAMKRIKQLQEYDTARTEKWIWDEYYTYINFKNYAKAEKLLLRNASRSSLFKEKLASFYLMRGKYRKSSMIYEELFASSRSYEIRKKFFFKLVGALESGKYAEAAAEKVHRYQSFYMKDREARKFMLKTYIATGHLDYASQLAKSILKRELR